MKSVATENPCRASTSYRDNPDRTHSALSCACSGLVVSAPRALSPRAQALSCQLNHDNRALAVAIPCHDIEPYVAT